MGGAIQNIWKIINVDYCKKITVSMKNRAVKYSTNY